MTPTISYNGKRFVRLCNCNSDWVMDWDRFGDRRNTLVGAITYPCPKCNYLAWIILPKEGK